MKRIRRMQKVNTEWERVSGPDLDPTHAVRAAANQKAFHSEPFRRACETVGLLPTKRQASRWKNKKGLAYLKGR